jgi:hypothetical protein
LPVSYLGWRQPSKFRDPGNAGGMQTERHHNLLSVAISQRVVDQSGDRRGDLPSIGGAALRKKPGIRKCQYLLGPKFNRYQFPSGFPALTGSAHAFCSGSALRVTHGHHLNNYVS